MITRASSAPLRRELAASVVIVGGGIIGLMLARQLHEEGKEVLVVEKNAHAALEASRAGGGIISPLHPWRYSNATLQLAQWSHEHYPRIAQELSLATGIYVPIKNTGMLVPNVLEAEAALKCPFLQAERVDRHQVADIEPGLSKPQDSVWVSEVNNVRNPYLCRALVADLQRRKVPVITHFDVQSVEQHAAGFVLQSQQGGRVQAEQVVVTAGAWSTDLLKLFTQMGGENDLAVPDIFPVKGQMLALRTKVGTLRSVILEGHHYLIPRHDGVVLIGSTVEQAGFDKQTTAQANEQLLEFAIGLMPALQYSPVISQWAGLRPGSHRDVPIITELEQVPGVFASVGHFRNGLLSAPASAQLMADLLMRRKSTFAQQDYAL